MMELKWNRACLLFVLFCLLLSANVKSRKALRIQTLHVCTDIKFRFATTRVTSHVTNPNNQSRHATFDITLPNDAFISSFSLETGGKNYMGRVTERQRAIRKFRLDSSYLEASASGARVTNLRRRRETNQFRVALKVGPMDSVTFNLTYQELLERRLGVYNHVVYIDPGKPVKDLRVDVSIKENRDITYLNVPTTEREDASGNSSSESNREISVQRPDPRHAYVSYHPGARQMSQDSPRHGLSDLFTVKYDVNRSMDAGEVLSVNGYFLHFIAPPLENPLPKDVLFILDTSTSMMAGKLQQLQDAMRVIVNDLAVHDRFAFMQFNSRATFWRRELLSVTSISIGWALEYIDMLKPRGYTNMDAALEQGLDFLNEERTVKGDNSLVIFLTDGRPTRGETNRDLILRNVRARNRKKISIYGLAFGGDADWALVKRLVSQNGGVGRRIYQDSDAALQIQGFYSEVSSLLLTGLRATYLESQVDVHTLTTSRLRQFFNGSELVVAGRLVERNQTDLRVLVQATGAEGQVNFTVAPDPDPDPLTSGQGQGQLCRLMSANDLAEIAERMWAYLTIRQRLQQRVGEDTKLKKQRLKKQAVDLALKYKFVTPVTSLVVSKPNSEEEMAILQEDDSDLVDEEDLPALENVTAILNKTANSSAIARGGGGGDPHFMIEMTSLPYPLCFDVRGQSGDAYLLLKDPVSGLTVNVELGQGHGNDHSAKPRSYIVRAAILFQDVIMELTTAHVTVNDFLLQWNQTKSVYLPGVWVMMKADNELRFALDWGVEIDVTRHVRRRANRNDQTYLNVEIQREGKLSPGSTGLLGQFIHKDIRLHRLKKRQSRVVAELEVLDFHQRISHGRALLRTRRDPFYGRLASCLMVDRLWSRTLDRPVRFYKVPSVFTT